jgi:hypothetical protein
VFWTSGGNGEAFRLSNRWGHSMRRIKKLVASMLATGVLVTGVALPTASAAPVGGRGLPEPAPL